MFLKKLTLKNYRNYSTVEMKLDHNINIFIGPNAQGKTNLLEAIYVMALTKSHRTNTDKELICWGKDETVLYSEVERKYGSNKLEIHLSQKGKKVKINGLEQRKLSDFIGGLNVVMFAPEDLEIVKGSPRIRRRFIDMELGQVQPSYIYDLQQYQKILNQRNNLLKQHHTAKDKHLIELLTIWDQQLAEFGIKIIKKRQHFIRKLQLWAEQIHSGITNEKEHLKVIYKPSFEIDQFDDETVLFNQFMLKLTKMREQEIKRGVTLIGPHRDDLLFLINDKEVQTFGSQGQQRTTALSIKLAEIELIHEEVGEYPLLLLDDVLSELDQYRQTQLIETFQNKVQTFITTTGVESVNLSKLKEAKLFHVLEGTVTV
ncbi:DNA replication/repair protein RecF [Chengkuizengella axinellae]|uniref:DNA replication and repair protein RecF n=1 Tax=Chengkuizengella axinellae TaxID=3064388 RepID=A0ABT9J385_9BACL|nr:DNA replication/repair protein RecF [Chengkuizengella sp. 2205SS18-9]MDP5276084.1 DNA replication/repair protein RecF [Chengkuizengella sp. 2205SS18-9]